MDRNKILNLLSYAKEEAPKFFLFMAVLYGIMYVAVSQEAQRTMGSNRQGQTTAPSFSSINKEQAPLQLQPDGIELPTLGVYAPLFLVESTDPKDFVAPLKRGVTHYPSDLPGNPGTAVILGHSAPAGWPRINYDWVFSKLDSLHSGDAIIVTFGNKEYTYQVKEKVTLQKGQYIPEKYLGREEGQLLLISCWPPGIDNKRIGVYAELSVN